MAGYEKVANVMTKHAELATFQRFDFLNTLNLLFLQAELTHLEDELRESMREDLESGRDPTPPTPNDHSGSIHASSRTVKDDENAIRDAGNSMHEVEHQMASLSRKPTARSEHRSNAESEPDQRAESGKDWYVLANMSPNATWKIMLKTREKLKEYDKLDKALLLYKTLKSNPSPNPSDLTFLRVWFTSLKLGNFPLLGLDSTLYSTSSPSELVALSPRQGDDPLGSVFLSKVYLWYHTLIGHRIKKHVDEEAQYFEYDDKVVLRVANVLGSVVGSVLLVGSVVALAFVKSKGVQLGLVAAFTQLFSLALVLITNARKVEVFAATAAFVAVQVVFVGTTTGGASGSLITSSSS